MMRPVARLTVLDTIYHQAVGAEPVTHETNFSRMLASDEQPYVRRVTAVAEWKLLDCGWVEPSMVKLENTAGQQLQVNPTREERRAIDETIVDVGVYHAGAYVTVARLLPGESLRFSPVGEIFFRCQSGECKCNLSAWPG